MGVRAGGQARQETVGQLGGVGMLGGQQLHAVGVKVVRAAAAVLAAVAVVGVEEQTGELDRPTQRLVEPVGLPICRLDLGQAVDRDGLIARVGAAVFFEPAFVACQASTLLDPLLGRLADSALVR